MFGSEEPQQRSALGRTIAVIKRTTFSEHVAGQEYHHPQMLVHHNLKKHAFDSVGRNDHPSFFFFGHGWRVGRKIS